MVVGGLDYRFQGSYVQSQHNNRLQNGVAKGF